MTSRERYKLRQICLEYIDSSGTTKILYAKPNGQIRVLADGNLYVNAEVVSEELTEIIPPISIFMGGAQFTTEFMSVEEMNRLVRENLDNKIIDEDIPNQTHRRMPVESEIPLQPEGGNE
jgi:hypothetical protein